MIEAFDFDLEMNYIIPNFKNTHQIFVSDSTNASNKFQFSSDQHNFNTQSIQCSEITKLPTKWREIFEIEFNKTMEFVPGDSIGIRCPNKIEDVFEIYNLLYDDTNLNPFHRKTVNFLYFIKNLAILKSENININFLLSSLISFVCKEEWFKTTFLKFYSDCKYCNFLKLHKIIIKARNSVETRNSENNHLRTDIYSPQCKILRNFLKNLNFDGFKSNTKPSGNYMESEKIYQSCFCYILRDKGYSNIAAKTSSIKFGLSDFFQKPIILQRIGIRATLNNYNFNGTLFEYFFNVFDFKILPKKSFLNEMKNFIYPGCVFEDSYMDVKIKSHTRSNSIKSHNPNDLIVYYKKLIDFFCSKNGSASYFKLYENHNSLFDIFRFFKVKPNLDLLFRFCEPVKMRYFSLVNHQDTPLKILLGVIKMEIKHRQNALQYIYGHSSDFFKNIYNYGYSNPRLDFCIRPNKLMRKNQTKNALCIASGTGIAPFLSFMNSKASENIWIIYGCRNKEDDLLTWYVKKYNLSHSFENNNNSCFVALNSFPQKNKIILDQEKSAICHNSNLNEFYTSTFDQNKSEVFQKHSIFKSDKDFQLTEAYSELGMQISDEYTSDGTFFSPQKNLNINNQRKDQDAWVKGFSLQEASSAEISDNQSECIFYKSFPFRQDVSDKKTTYGQDKYTFDRISSLAINSHYKNNERQCVPSSKYFYTNTKMNICFSSKNNRVTTFLESNVSEVQKFLEKNCDIYICGNANMQENTIKILKALYTIPSTTKIHCDNWQ